MPLFSLALEPEHLHFETLTENYIPYIDFPSKPCQSILLWLLIKEAFQNVIKGVSIGSDDRTRT